MTSQFRNSIQLNNGLEMPLLGLGTWKSKPGEVEKAVEHALRNGYQHLDCAACYGNENEVGNGIKAAGVEREKVFVTSKLWNNKHHPDDVEPGFKRFSKELKDFLILKVNFPQPADKH